MTEIGIHVHNDSGLAVAIPSRRSGPAHARCKVPSMAMVNAGNEPGEHHPFAGIEDGVFMSARRTCAACANLLIRTNLPISVWIRVSRMSAVRFQPQGGHVECRPEEHENFWHIAPAGREPAPCVDLRTRGVECAMKARWASMSRTSQAGFARRPRKLSYVSTRAIRMNPRTAPLRSSGVLTA